MSAIGIQLRRRPHLFALALTLVLLAANLIVQPSFGDPGNWAEELATLAPFALVTIASTPSVLGGGGGLDLSVGPLMVVVNVVLVTWLLPARGLDSAWVDVPILLAVGAGVGLLNGVLVALLRFQPIIATLCTFFVLGGLAEAISPNQAIAGPNWTTSLGEKLGFFPGALVLIAVPLVLWLALGLTSFRRTLLAVGSSDTAAYSAGVNVTAVRLAAYCLGGVFAAVGGIALTALVESSQSDQATAFTVLALAAVALGGTPIGRGGRGGMVGSLFGALSIYLIQTLLGAAQVSSAYLQLVYGAMLLTGIVVAARMQLAGRGGVRAVRA